MQYLVVSFLLLSLFILFLSTPVWCNNSTSMSDMMEDMGMTMPTICYTPPDLEDIFLRACGKVLSNSNTCPSVWSEFVSSFGNKDPNTVTGDDYNGYFRIVPIVSPPNTVLFWSSVKAVIEQISKYTDISSSANQDSSGIINAMIADDGVECWCGNETHLLDTVNPCPMAPGPTTIFWQKFSCLLGESATGIAFWVGYGDKIGGAYQDASFFAQYEFPKLTPDRVQRLVVIDLYDCIANTGETCGQGTLARLQSQAVEKYGSAGYQCDEVCGNPSDEQQVSSLANRALGIIRKQQGCKYIATYSYTP